MENTNKGDTLQTTDAVGVSETAKKQNKHQPCTKEPQMGNVTWQYDVVQKNYMCTVCGERESAEGGN